MFVLRILSKREVQIEAELINHLENCSRRCIKVVLKAWFTQTTTASGALRFLVPGLHELQRQVESSVTFL